MIAFGCALHSILAQEGFSSAREPELAVCIARWRSAALAQQFGEPFLEVQRTIEWTCVCLLLNNIGIRLHSVIIVIRYNVRLIIFLYRRIYIKRKPKTSSRHVMSLFKVDHTVGDSCYIPVCATFSYWVSNNKII